jgi:hypothetical protein
MKLWIGIVVVLFFLAFGKLYVNDSATAEQALVVEEYLKNYCRLYNSYPEYQKIEKRFPKLYPHQEWYYWPNETLTNATFQYPMTLPLPFAHGRSKFSEFIPIIYSYAVRNPCKGLIQ